MQLNMELNLIFYLFIIVRDGFSVNLENNLDYMTDILQYNRYILYSKMMKTTEIAFSFLAAYTLFTIKYLIVVKIQTNQAVIFIL